MIGHFTNNLQKLSTHPLIHSSNNLIAVALSGGSDSLALTLLAKEAGLNVVALTVDHQLRSESAQEAAQVADWMQHHDISHYILRWEQKPIGNLQAAARKARYQLLIEECKRRDIAVLLLGHTEDDQAETIAYRQERRSGAIGLAGMTARQNRDGVTIFRPLLNISRGALREYLQSRNQPWIDDPSNENDHFARIRIRQYLLQHPKIKLELLALGKRMAVERQKIERGFAEWCKLHTLQSHAELVSPSTFLPMQTEALIPKQVLGDTGNRLGFDRSAFSLLSQEEACYALSRMLVTVSGREYPPRFAELQRLIARLTEAEGKAALGHCIIRWNAHELSIVAERQGMAISAKPLVPEPFCTIYEE